MYEDRLGFVDNFKLISPVFYVLVALASGLGWGLFTGLIENKIFVFLFVILSWVISVSIHEYGHAITAYFFGDLSIQNKGYLALNPLKYTNGVNSILFPILILAMGGIGLPGGAVYINFSRIRSKGARSLVSAAGPIMQTLFAFFLLAIYYYFGSDGLNDTNRLFWSAFSFLLFIQITSIFFNLIPFPPLDGFGIIRPYLPKKIVTALNNFRRFTMWIIFAIFMSNTPIRYYFWGLIDNILYMFGISRELVMEGWSIFQFWR
jgi:Zn-dependent protease